MSWLRIDDKVLSNIKIMMLGRTKKQRNEAFGALVRIWAWCASERSDGFVVASVVEEVTDAPLLAKLCRSVFDRAPLLHTPGQECDCLAGRSWRKDAAYLVHDWLKYNPSRAETDVAAAKKKELRDKELRQAVRERDGDRCRYCAREVSWADHRSSRGGVLDHVVPDRAAGADNLVVACRGCNTRKRDRTPAAAGMTLLPPPGGPLYEPLLPARGHEADPRQTHDGSGSEPGSDPGSDPKPDPEPTTGPVAGPDPGPQPPPTPPPAPDDAGQSSGAPADRIRDETTDPTRRAATDAPGRAGTGTQPGVGGAGDAGPAGRRPTVGPPDTPRSSHQPNPYLRHTITGPQPDEHAGHPPPDSTSPPARSLEEAPR